MLPWVKVGIGVAGILSVLAIAFIFNLGDIRDSFAGNGKAVVWEGKRSSDWDDKKNWKGNKLPKSSETAIITNKYRYAPTIKGSSIAEINDLEIEGGAEMFIEGKLTINEDLKLQDKAELTVEGSLDVKEDLFIKKDGEFYLKKDATAEVSKNIEIEEGYLYVEGGKLKVNENIILDKKDSYLIQTGGSTIIEKDLELVSSEKKGDVDLDVREGVFRVKGSTRFYRSDDKDEIKPVIKVKGGTVHLNELSREKSSGKSIKGDYTFNVSGGLLNFWEDAIMDSSSTSGNSGSGSSKVKYCDGVDDWDKKTTYKRGSANEMIEVKKGNHLYRLKQDYWWSKNDKPNNGKKSKWIRIGKCGDEDESYNCSKVDDWDSNKKYQRQNSDEETYVKYNGKIYRQHKSNWYTKGNRPDNTKWAWVEHATCNTSSSSFKDEITHTGGTIRFHKKSVRPSNFTSKGTGLVQFKDTKNNVLLQSGEKYCNVIIDTSATVELKGDIEVTGDIINNSTNKPKGTFKFKLTGSANQKIGGNKQLEFEKLEINKSSGSIYLEQDLRITSEVIFTSKTGVVHREKGGRNKSSNISEVTFEDGATYTGDGWFEGPVTKEGDDAFVFPIGKDGRKGKLAMSAPSSSATFTAEYFVDRAPNNSNIGSSLQRVSAIEHWSFNRDAGTADVAVSLYWEDGDWSKITVPADLLVSRYNGTEWESVGNGETVGNVSSGHIKSNGLVSNFGFFTFGSNSSSNPLPVDLISFTGERSGSDVYLDWSTSAEENNEGFEVQRSEDGINFTVVGTVDGAGTTLEPQTYSFVDYNAPQRDLYYRLKQNDFDGTSEIHRTVLVKSLGGSANGLSETSIKSVYPSPFTDQFTLEFTAASAGNALIRITNVQGNVVFEENMSVFEGDNKFSYQNGGSLQRGYFIISLSLNGKTVNHKVLKN